MQQASDFLAESEALDRILSSLGEEDFRRETGFKAWTFETILRHLHFWNVMAHVSLAAPDDFQEVFKPVMEGMMAGTALPEIEVARFPATDLALLDEWRRGYQEVFDAFSQADPSERVAWAGPSMSARSSVTARQMETWAHGQAIFDELGMVRKEEDRIRNIVILGVNTFGWTFTVKQLPVPEEQPFLALIAPSGEPWEFGSPDSGQIIRGAAHEFAQVVTQTRNVADTELVCEGEAAALWMQHAQCFAGGPSEPPPPGERRAKNKD
jgi:uncharacterized protein (TIGR03084 family)